MTTDNDNSSRPADKRHARKKNAQQHATLEQLRSSRERVMLHQLQRKISLAPKVDRHPPEKIGDFLPQWFEKNISKSGDLLAAVSETLQAALPEKLFRTIAPGPLMRGHLTLYCSNSTAKMEIDALLRQTLLRTIQIATKGLIFKVKIVVNREYSTG